MLQDAKENTIKAKNGNLHFFIKRFIIVTLYLMHGLITKCRMKFGRFMIAEFKKETSLKNNRNKNVTQPSDIYFFILSN